MKSYIIDGLEYRVLWTYELTPGDIDDYLTVHEKVFKAHFTQSDFKRKFLDNIYGDSIHVFVYDNNAAVAIRSFWRNDLNSAKAYQPCDTCVLSEYRGRGIFINMTKPALELIGDSLIYNFPNDNSRKLYLKNGWKIHGVYYKNIYTRFGFRSNYHEETIPDEYVKWMVAGRDNVYIYRDRDNCYLITPRGKGMYIIIGVVSLNIYNSGLFKRVFPLILFYRSQTKSKIERLNHQTFIVTKGDINQKIPYWKIDAI